MYWLLGLLQEAANRNEDQQYAMRTTGLHSRKVNKQANKLQSGFAGYKVKIVLTDKGIFLQSMHTSLFFGSWGMTPCQYLQTQALDSPCLHVCHQTCVHFYNNSYMNWKEMSYSWILFNKITIYLYDCKHCSALWYYVIFFLQFL